MLSALAGLAAASSQAPSMRNAGAVILGVAGGLALAELLRATAAGPAAVPPALPAAA